MRLRLDLAYDGSGFHGWATQPDLRTVQGELEAALDTVLRTRGSSLTVAGRTDTGVHARGQVAHVDVVPELLDPLAGRGGGPAGDPAPDSAPDPAPDPCAALLRRVNGVLDPDVRLRRVAVAAAGFDARFSALWRRYAYRVADTPAALDPLARGHVLAHPRPVDEAAMNAASAHLLGEHDFASFCKRREGATTVRALLALAWTRDEAGVLTATVRADAFCHHMVRSLVGCLLAVGEGRRTPQWPADVLAARQRDSAVAVVPAHGLSLEEVAYPADADLAARVDQTRRRRELS